VYSQLTNIPISLVGLIKIEFFCLAVNIFAIESRIEERVMADEVLVEVEGLCVRFSPLAAGDMNTDYSLRSSINLLAIIYRNALAHTSLVSSSSGSGM
jgi:hypothetical protein